MKAYVLVKNGSSAEAFELQEKNTPAPGAHEVLIESEGFGLNFADVMARLGLYKDCPPLPAVIGYENVGRIKALGDRVSDFQIGDRVLAFTRFGGYADHVLTPDMGIVKISENLSVGEATALATQYITAYYCSEEAARLHAGDHVLIHAAAGGVGTALIQMLKYKGCIIFGTAGSPEKLNYLKSLGVDYPINYREENYEEAIQNLGFASKIDVTFNPIGGDYVKKDFSLLRAGGKVILFGASKMTEVKGNFFKLLKLAFGFGFWSPIKFVTSSRSIVGVNMLRVADEKPALFKQNLEAVVKLYDAGIIKPTVGKEFDHTELAAAHDYLGGRQSVGKVAIRW